VRRGREAAGPNADANEADAANDVAAAVETDDGRDGGEGKSEGADVDNGENEVEARDEVERADHDEPIDDDGGDGRTSEMPRFPAICSSILLYRHRLLLAVNVMLKVWPGRVADCSGCGRHAGRGSQACVVQLLADLSRENNIL